MLILLLSLPLSQSLTVDVVDATLLTRIGFQVSQPIRRRTSQASQIVDGGFFRQSDPTDVSVLIERSTLPTFRADKIDAWNGMMAGGKMQDMPVGAWSGMPIGDQSYNSISQSGSGSRMYIFADNIFYHTRIANFGKSINGDQKEWSGQDKVGDRFLVEGLARDTIANALGLDLVNAENATVNGQSIPGTKIDPAGRVFVPVQAWASARGLALSVNREHGTLSFTRSGTMYVIAVAANRAKRGTEWRSLGGFIVRSDGKHYAPLAGLESLL